nr:RNA-directed DNA polymerase, eukaryota, reverse transcriptase zinc-binding domain protein [Tanacetum cinerariifolium]
MMHKKIGNGLNTSFWEDRWRGEQRLKEVFPHIYALEINKHISVAFKFKQTSLFSSLRRMPRSGIESEQWDHLLDSLEGVMLSPSEDRWSWDLNGSGEFSIASAQRYIDTIDYQIFLPKQDGLKKCILNSMFTLGSVVRAIFRRVCIWWDVSYMAIDSFDEWISWITNLRLPSKHKSILEGNLHHHLLPNFHSTQHRLPLNLRSSSFVTSTLVVVSAMAMKKPEAQKKEKALPAAEPTKSDGGKQKKKLSPPTSTAFKIALALHMPLSILKFGRDMPHLSKQGKLHQAIHGNNNLSRDRLHEQLSDVTAHAKLMSLTRVKQQRLRFPSSFPWISAPNDQTLDIAPEDGKLLQEDVSATSVKKNGLQRKPAENNTHFTAAGNQSNGCYPTLEADSQSMLNYEKDDGTDHERICSLECSDSLVIEVVGGEATAKRVPDMDKSATYAGGVVITMGFSLEVVPAVDGDSGGDVVSVVVV